MKFIFKTLIYFSIIFICEAYAQPIFNKIIKVKSFSFYEDKKDPAKLYYCPSKLDLKLDANGEPKVKLISMRYTGTQAMRDQMANSYKNILQVTVVMDQSFKKDLPDIKKELSTTHPGLKLVPLSICRINASVNFLSIGNNKSEARKVEVGFAEPEKDPVDEYWNERTFTFSVDNQTAQIMYETLKKGMLSLSINYSFGAKMYYDSSTIILADSTLREAITEFSSSSDGSIEGQEKLGIYPVSENAIPIYIDTEKYPQLLIKLDINEQLPPGFAVLEIRCYDFEDNVSSEFYSKTIDIEATGVGGQIISSHFSFFQSNADVHNVVLKFPYAVRIDKPYRYRLTQVKTDGSSFTSLWYTNQSWTAILDITHTEKSIWTFKRNQ
ncbi:hypothetical protein BH11BAC1_BH11BAC1_13190 [soil metagenome]